MAQKKVRKKTRRKLKAMFDDTNHIVPLSTLVHVSSESSTVRFMAQLILAALIFGAGFVLGVLSIMTPLEK